MGRQQNNQDCDVEIVYRSLPGFTLAATVLVDGHPVYAFTEKTNLQSARPEIFTVLDRYTPQIRQDTDLDNAGGADDENDPDHQAWMRSVCSGE
jgi:hypothetical protein